MPLLIIKRHDREIRRFSFHGDIITIGRESPASYSSPDLALRDSLRKVSRYHATIIRDRRGFYFIRDLASANGTLVNGKLVYGKRLMEGDRISIGDFNLRYSEQKELMVDLSNAIRLVSAAPVGRDISRKTVLEDIHEDIPGHLPEGIRQTMHDILNRLRSLSGTTGLNDEMLDCIIPAVNAIRGFIAAVEVPFAVVPEAVYGVDIDNGEQMSVSAEFIQQAMSQGVARASFFAGVPILCCPIRLDMDREGIIYLECDRGASFTEEDRTFLESLCGCLPSVIQELSKTADEEPRPAMERFDWAVDMIAKSSEMREVLSEIAACADIASNVLLRGGTGTGKEVTARTIHARSARSNGPFVPVELSNMEREMVSSTLFGWVKGAFTGADRDAQGAFEKAAGGSIFLDEIGDISHDVQIKLRRAVEEKEICPVGSASAIDVDVKVIAATNVDLDRAVEQDSFRDDLLQRFGKRITLPPLRERKADIPLLVYFFIDKCEAPIRAVSHGAMRTLMKYSWPGNIRELREVIHELATRQKEIIFSFDLPDRIKQAPGEEGDVGVNTMEETEKREIIRVLNMTGWNKTRAAQILGYRSKQTLYNKLKKYNIEDPRDISPDTE